MPPILPRSRWPGAAETVETTKPYRVHHAKMGQSRRSGQRRPGGLGGHLVGANKRRRYGPAVTKRLVLSAAAETRQTIRS
jgi:hypothetical protein